MGTLSDSGELLYSPFHTQNSTAFVTPVVEHWLEREIAQWVQ